jgi:hypothetical protein
MRPVGTNNDLSLKNLDPGGGVHLESNNNGKNCSSP